MELEDKVAIVTGGSGGIGRAIALRLAREGCRLTIVGKTPDRVDNAVAELTGSGYEAVGIPTDVRQLSKIKNMVSATVTKYGAVHILVNSVAVPVFGSFLTLTDDAWISIFETKYLGYIRCVRAVLPHMIDQKYGRIINITGGSAREPTPLHLPGGGANAAITHFTKGLARDVGKHNIRVNCIAPGEVASERLMTIQKTIARETHTTYKSVLAKETANIPLGRLAEPDEIAEAALFLASERSSYINGASVLVDGGYSRSV